MALLGLVTDITTIYAYFRNGNTDWGIIATVFTCAGWGMFVLVALRGSGTTSGGLSSDWMNRLSDRSRAVLTGLQLTAVLFQLDSIALLWEHRHDKRKRAEAIGKSTDELNTIKSYESIFKTVPLLVLHTYILLVNQLSSKYLGKRYTGLDRLSQIGSIASGVYFLGPCYISSVFSGASWRSEPTVSWLNKEAVLGSWRKQLLAVFFAVDSCVRVLRVAVLASCVHGWVTLGIACAWLVLVLLSAFLRHGSMQGFAVGSFTSSMGLFVDVEPPSCLFPVLDALCTIVMLAVPFALPARPYVHLHGVCSLLSDVNAGDNCFPLPLVASVATLLLLHWVR